MNTIDIIGIIIFIIIAILIITIGIIFDKLGDKEIFERKREKLIGKRHF